MKIIEQHNMTSIAGITYFGPNAKLVYLDSCGNRSEMVWSAAPTGADVERIQQLVEARMTIDNELKEKGVALTPNKDGVSWSRT